MTPAKQIQHDQDSSETKSLIVVVASGTLLCLMIVFVVKRSLDVTGARAHTAESQTIIQDLALQSYNTATSTVSFLKSLGEK